MKKFLALIALCILASCVGEKEQSEVTTDGEGKAQKTKNKSFLPDAAGETGEIVIVMNKKKFDKKLGEAIKAVFRETVPGLTRPEPMFTIRVIEPSEMNRIFKVARNLVYVISYEGRSAADQWLQNTFSEVSRDRIFSNPDLFMQTSEDQYAKGQKILQLFGTDDDALIKNLNKNSKIVQNYFNIAEKERLSKSIRMSSESRVVLRKVNDKLGVNIKIPSGYELAMLEDDFAWVRALPAVGPSKNLVIYSKPYTSESEFEQENIIKLRNEIGKQYIFGDPENPESFMTTETKYMEPVFRNINFNNQYTVEMKGAWKTNNFSVGGTFVSYTFVDDDSKRLYYIEGFVIHPSEDHRELIREMESLLTTFRVS
ncbi:DUF4837 family protein [Roseivirga misakiensis]|uniref:DUF4837 family protein n=1 Tax=Roseivirga misakiensis TaxID=1563681 RepID=UPI000A42072B|nr:DUF4837 family protein [Roseivirga misakiensis]